MRTLTLLLSALICQLFSFAQKECASAAYAEKLVQEDPAFKLRLLSAGVALTANGQNNTTESGYISASTVITIPVVVHVLYSTDVTNISDDQILSQIEALNANYNKSNVDFTKVPAAFAKVAGISNIRFELAKVDPAGRATNGITRKKSSREIWTSDDKVKSTTYGGEAAWDASSYLNIWVCNTVGGLLGYSSPVGAAADKDGIVIRFNAFGTRGNVTAPFHLGRTAVHEVGHWLNLKHLWGDSECGSDEVDDTPAQRTYNRGVPNFPLMSTACSTVGADGVMFMNFMDFTDDAGMMMFTNGQINRMRNLFQPGAFRNSLLSSKALGKVWNTTITASAAAIETNAVATMQVKLYPNPANSFIMLELSNPTSIDKGYGIYSADGRKMAQGALSVEYNRINIQSFTPGIYFVRLGDKVVRFVKN
jgi:hypothetical protein